MLLFDSSVLINICHSGIAEKILNGIPSQRFIAPSVYRETMATHKRSNFNCTSVDSLLDLGLIAKLSLDQKALRLFANLVSAEPPHALGDGEAATIALSLQTGGALATDDRKARRIYGERFPAMKPLSTAQILRLYCDFDLGPALTNMIEHSRMAIFADDRAWLERTMGRSPQLEKTSHSLFPAT